jgi:CrcB protein
VQQLIAIAGGGALGAVFRFLMASHIYRLFGKDFPFGTLSVNVLGSFLMGLFFILIIERGMLSGEWRSIIIIGFLGAFTTFSTFSIETLTLLESGELSRAALNIFLSVALCLMATWLGLVMGRQL